MLCEECKKNEATYHSITKVNGVTNEKHLCVHCHSKSFQDNMKLTEISQLFSGFNSLFASPKKRSTVMCSRCGTTAEEFLNSGYVGCAECYNELSEVILPVVQKVQDDMQHKGKTPQGLMKSMNSEYERLSTELKRAVDIEDFERASVIRDEMRKLKGE